MKTEMNLAAAIVLLGMAVWMAFVALRRGWSAYTAHRVHNVWSRDNDILLAGMSFIAFAALAYFAHRLGGAL